jgi:polyisoprenoid-binding protein YceI
MQSSTPCKTYAIVAAESHMLIEAHSTLPNPIRGRATGLSGTISASVEGGRLMLDPMPSMRVVIPISKLSSGNEFQDREVRNLIGGPRDPNIVAELRRVTPGSKPDVYLMAGAITLKGSTQDYDAEVTIRVDGRRITFDGAQKMDIRKFGIKPPRILSVQIYPDFDVTMHLVAELAN